MNARYNPHEIESKWHELWDEQGLYHAEPGDKTKFFITIPYPYLNGNLHAGHTRTFTIGDVIARYKRMLGINVLFPMGFHVTGTPIVGLAELIQKRDPETMRVYTGLHGVPYESLIELVTPERIVEYFSREAEASMRSIGFSIDWRRKFTTTDPAYKKFITWQFNLLRSKGRVVRGSHPVRWCPNDQNPVEDHDILRGEDANIIDYTLIKFNMDGLVLPCATLRPETVFGVTNLWVNPDIVYQKIKADGETWAVSREAFDKLRHTDKKVEILGEIPGGELIGKTVKNPVTGSEVLILPASFVRPENGSGIVMSVPAHAPYDYLALRDLAGKDLKKYGIMQDVSEIKPIALIQVPGYGEYPAIDAVKELGAKDQSDPKAEEATKLVYRREFHNGVLTETTGRYADTPVAKIKDILNRDLIKSGVADVLYEFSEQPVVCRCGATCVVKIVEDQWFLNYSDPEWKELVYECLRNMQIIPPELRADFENKVDWLKDKACARRKGLGTRLPWDQQWLIESLGDSTIYMSYYIIAKFLNTIAPEQMSEEFFDFVLLGKGKAGDVARTTGIDAGTLDSIRSEFGYWYPVDLRSSGKDLIPNHLLFFLFHHAAIFPKDKWPRAIAINGFVSLEGQKMSKSKGPLLTLRQAVADFGADISRLYILGAAEHVADADWRTADVETTRKQLERFYRWAHDASGKEPQGEMRLIDRWMRSRLQYRIKETADALDNIQTRRALHNSFYLLMNDVKWYERRGGERVGKDVLRTWVRLLAPFTPHLCEEIWREMLGERDFISNSSYPAPDAALIDREAELAEELVQNTLRDIEEILRLKKVKPGKVILYTSQAWKTTVFRQALDLRSGVDMKTLMGRLMSNPQIRKHAKEVPKFVQKISGDIQGMSDYLIDSIRGASLDELASLNEAKDFLSREIGCQFEVASADSAGYDPQGKSKFAVPLRPAIYIE